MPKPKLISPVTKQAVQKKRVAAYCRVSSNSADQLHSYDAQVKAYTRLINRNPDWELVDVFADEGISGMKTDNRPEFKRMILMCEMHQIDLILTKSVSRFARNVKEALAYVRELRLLGVGVNFEKEGINTLALGDEMLLNTFSAISQEESKSISQNQRFSIVKRMESGEFVDSNVPYGFRLVDKHLEVYEPEAEIVRQVFAMYLNGLSTKEIARELTASGIPTKHQKNKWNSNSISLMLTNEKYAGDSRFQKKYRDTTVPFKQYKNKGQEDMYYAPNTHPSLLDRETYENVKALFEKKQKQFGKTEDFRTYPLTGRIRCSECGSSYRRKVRDGTVKWVCAKHFEDSSACNSGYYSEERIYDGIARIVNKLRFGEEEILAKVIQELRNTFQQYKMRNREARELSQNVAELRTKLLMLEELRSKGYLEADVYHAQVRDIQQQIKHKEKARQDSFSTTIQTKMEEIQELKKRLDSIDSPMEQLDESLLHDIVKEMEVNRRDELTVTLLGGLKFTEII